MEIVRYEFPTHWDDKGMDWSRPDPTNADYIMSIRQALLERYAALHRTAYYRVPEISPCRPVSRSAVEGIVQAVEEITSRFVNVGWEDFKEDYSDFPRMWTYSDLVRQEGCRLYEFAKAGDLCRGGGEWLRQIRNAIDKLTVIRAERVCGTMTERSGTEHDPPFDEAIGTAMRRAFESERTVAYDGTFPTSLTAWSGNTHWKCPIPDYEGDPKDNEDGYCGYAESRSYVLKGALSWLKGAEFDIFAAVVATAPTGPVNFSEELATSVFDASEPGFGEGLNWTEPVRAKEGEEFEMRLGNVESIPQNEVVPSSDFDEDGHATHRRSAKRGWDGRVWGFIDYGVKGGFKFRAKEE